MLVRLSAGQLMTGRWRCRSICVWMNKMEDVLRTQGILNLNACIAAPKTDGDAYLTDNSMKFHERMGYQMVGRFHDSGYKFGRWYDMVWMEKILGEHKTPAASVRPFKEVCKDFGLEPGYRY